MRFLALFLLAACEDPPPVRGPHPDPPKKPTEAERREAHDRDVRDAAKASGYAFAVCTNPTRAVDTVVLVIGKDPIELVPTARGHCFQFDGLQPGRTATYSLRPQDNSLVRGLSVCAPSPEFREDDPNPNPCTHLSKTDANGFYTFVVHPRFADEPVIEIGPLRPGAPLMWPDDDPDAAALIPPVPAEQPANDGPQGGTAATSP